MRLYWIRRAATLTDKRVAKEIGAAIRDRRAWHPGDTREDCEAVAGDPPPPYQHLPRIPLPKNAEPPSVSPPDPASKKRTYRRRKKPDEYIPPSGSLP